MGKLDIATKVNLTLKLFTALVRNNYEEALCLLKIASLDTTGIQSSKAKAFVDSGECDSKDKLQIFFFTRSHCNECIGLTSISPSGVDQFYGKDSCTISPHNKAQVHILPPYIGNTCSTLPQNDGNLPLPFFGGNYPIFLLDNIY